MKWRRLVLRVVLAVVALGANGFAFLNIYWWRDLQRAIAEFERDVGPLDYAPWNDAPRGSVLTDDNPAKWLIAGADTIFIDEAESDLMRLRWRPPEDWSTAELDAARQLLERHRPALETMSRAVPLAASTFPVHLGSESEPESYREHVRAEARRRAPSPDDPLSEVLFRQIRGMQLALVAGSLAFADGDCAAATGHVELLARQGGVLGAVPTFLGGLWGMSSARSTIEMGRDVALRCPSIEVIERLERALDELERTRWRADRVVAVEAMYMVRGLREERSSCQGSSRCWPRWLGRAWLGIEAFELDFWRALVVASRAPWPEVGRAAVAFEETDRYRWPWQRLYQVPLIPNILHGIGHLQVTDSVVRLARVAVAVRLEGSRTGVYPTPEGLPPFAREATLYQGEVPVYETSPAGARVALPRSAAVWIEGQSIPDFTPMPPLFEWLLPPLTTGAPSADPAATRPPS